MDKLSGRVDALTPEQRALLEARVKKKGLIVDGPRKTDGVMRDANAAGSRAPLLDLSLPDERDRQMKFSLYFFSDDGSSSESEKYALVLESAKFADLNGFSAIWTPERHFQKFGGLYPNPSVLAAALSVITTRIQIRAGSVALPLHHPVRVAEEWSVVDNLSHGRAGVSFASGWHPDDFIFAPSVYENRKEIMFDYIDKIKRLWAGEEVAFESANETALPLRILPKPIQASLPVWITTAGNPATWAKAGEIGANVLCALVGYSFEDLAGLIQLYRKSRAENGHGALAGQVTVMVHTYIGEDEDAVKEIVRDPMCGYLSSYFQQFEGVAQGSDSVTAADRFAIVSRAFETYYDASLLIGTMNKCRVLVDRLADAGVDEVACLIDFGLDFNTVIEGLDRLRTLKQQYDPGRRLGALGVPSQYDGTASTGVRSSFEAP
ncbi:MAG TPA: MupA/Atu3671 family FMN-dependent luciferase-like monooxygenase [Blastocatellia bacterium]|nr:MupA/Atu3671 family FMN-dependent luciferase-like monooxygenase [Blastocatellia bacterium]